MGGNTAVLRRRIRRGVYAAMEPPGNGRKHLWPLSQATGPVRSRNGAAR